MPAPTLTADRDTEVKLPDLVRYRAAQSVTIYKGALIRIHSGRAQPFVEASGALFGGIAYEAAATGASDVKYVRVQKTGVHRLTWWDDNAIAEADIGAEVYAASDKAVCPNASGSGATNKVAQNIKCGVVVGIAGSDALVRIDGYTR